MENCNTATKPVLPINSDKYSIWGYIDEVWSLSKEFYAFTMSENYQLYWEYETRVPPKVSDWGGARSLSVRYPGNQRSEMKDIWGDTLQMSNESL